MYKFRRTGTKLLGLNLFGLCMCSTNVLCDYDETIMKQYKGKVMDGRTFKRVFRDYEPCKVIGNNHNSFDYKLGVIENNEEFNPNGECEGGGLYFTDIKHIRKYFRCYGNKVAILELLDDEKICIEDDGSKCKTNSFVVKNILDECAFVRYLERSDYENFKALIKEKPSLLEHAEDQPADLCMEIVKNNWWALKCVKNQTPEICMVAVKYNGLALEYVKNQTPEICEQAIKNDWRALEYVKNQTPELCKLAIDENPRH